ncbi:MAG: pilus assembly protein CpaF [Phycisphaerae bacterium]|nr:pilus assembly protein CpaF [Phycisphaerae bacterium]
MTPIVATKPEVSKDELKARVQRRLLESIDLQRARELPEDVLRRECTSRVDGLLQGEGTPLSNAEKEKLITQVINEIFGLGPLEELLTDPAISDILINGPKKIYVEKGGRLQLSEVTFRDNEHLLQVVQRIATAIGRRVDESSPMLDARLADGSRVNAIINPLALDGASVSIRRFGRVPFDLSKLVEVGAATPDMMRFLHAAVGARLNVVISGGTGSGKTTLLNCLSKCIPDSERVITIEDAAELQLQRDHVVRLETRPANIEGKGLITQRDLVKNALRMRPDRVIIGECRGGEALDMLQAMNTGHDGSMTTLHSNGTRDTIRRLESMVSIAGTNYPINTIRQQISSAVQVLVHADRLTGGRRKIMAISEITGMESDAVLLQDVFRFVQTGIDDDGNAVGYHESCGVRPKCLERIRSEGFSLPDELFFGGGGSRGADTPTNGSAPATAQIRFTGGKGPKK